MRLAYEHLWPLLSLALLPLILHWIARTRAPEVLWPALRFYLSGGRRTRRRVLLHEALLVFARTLALAAIVFGLLGPELRPGVAPLGDSRPRAAVAFLDTSWSMTARNEEGRSSFERARDALTRLVRTADRPAPLVVLYGTQGHEERSWSERPSETALETFFSDIEPAPEPFLLGAALDALFRRARRVEERPLVLAVLSDFQAPALEGFDPAVAAFHRRRIADLEDVRLVLADCSASKPVNRFVKRFASDGLACGVERPLPLEIAAGAVGTPPPLRASVRLDGETIAEIQLPPLTARARVRVPLPHPGPMVLRAAIEPDGFSADDARYLPLEVRAGVRVLVVDREDGRAGRMIELALRPRAPGAAPASLFRPERSSELDTETLAPFECIVVAAGGKIGRPERKAIEAYLLRGGALVVFASPGLDAAAWTEELHRGGAGPLPAAPEPWARKKLPEHPAALESRHPALGGFEDASLRAVEFNGFSPVSETSPGAEVLARLEPSGAVWIAERDYALGRVIWVGTSPLPEAGDFGASTVFVPLLDRIVRYALSRSEEGRKVTAGGELVFTALGAGDTQDAVIVTPGDRSFPASLERIGFDAVRVRHRTARPGPYFLELRGPEGVTRRVAGAADLDLKESILAKPPPDSFERIVQGLGAVLRSEEVTAGPEAAATPQVRPLASWVFLLGFACLVLEGFLLAGLSPRSRRRAP